jgi:CRP/FNR family cyclic AMP-dependent transcriptional regulator
MPAARKSRFDPAIYLAAAGIARRTVRLKAKHLFFSQGDQSNAIFYLESGHAKLIVVSKRGKEATVSLLVAGDFIGEETLAGLSGIRTSTAVAVTACVATKLNRDEMMRLLREQHEFSDLFLKFVLLRAIRTQEDLVDQLFNNSEKRLARTLLLMAEFGKPGDPETLLPPITQEALAHMIGTTRSRVSFFMNRFRKLGFIEYNGRIHVRKALLNVVLQDKLPEQNARLPELFLHSDPKLPRKKKRAIVA